MNLGRDCIVIFFFINSTRVRYISYSTLAIITQTEMELSYRLLSEISLSSISGALFERLCSIC